jgi:acyl homoserine lactone synthase
MMLRRDVFIEKMNWGLTSYKALEFEQYDTIGYATYVVAHEDETVLAGCRLIRCDSVVGSPTKRFTYMIKDAYDGRINLPSGLCFESPPEDETHWELTRLAAIRGNRQAVLAVMRTAQDYLIAQNAKSCVCLASPVVQRLARLSGFETLPMGPVCGNEDGKFLAFEIPVGTHSVLFTDQ